MPYTRIMAAFMLATLISTIFALPANATANDVGVSVTPVPATAPSGTAVVYTITVTNTDVLLASVPVTLTDNIGNGTYVSNDQALACAFVLPTLTCAVPSISIAATWVVQVTVTAPLSTAGAFVNTAALPADGNLANNSAVTTVPVTPIADVTIAKSHAGTLLPGSDVTYSLQVNNVGPNAATSVSVSDTLNAALTFKSSASSCTAVLQVVTCPVLDVPAAGSQTVTFVATIGAAVAAGTVITNTAIVSTATPESNAGNDTSNVDSLTVGALAVDLGVTITVLPTTAAPGDSVTYTVTVTNPDIATDATNVVVTDALPVGLTAVTPPTAPSGGTVAVVNNTWTWTIPTVTKATSASTPTSVTTTFDAIVALDTVLTTITNTVTMTATQTDPTPANNTASVDLTIASAVADLDVITAVDNAKPNQGDQINIAIQVSNVGPGDATNVVLKDVLPKGLTYDSCTPCNPSGLRRSTSQLFTIGSISANSAATLILTVTVTASSGTLKNTASITSADQSDPISSNDKDTLQITIAGTNNSGGSGSGGTSGTGGTSTGTSGTTAFTGFTAGQLMPWFLLLCSVGLAAIELGRRKTLVSPIGFTYGFDPLI